MTLHRPAHCTERYPPAARGPNYDPHALQPGVAEATEVYHQHRWVFEAADPTGIIYHCDAHDPPQVRRVPHAAAWPEP